MREMIAATAVDGLTLVVIIGGFFLFLLAIYAICYCIFEVSGKLDERAGRLELAVRQREELRRALGRR